MPPGVPEITDRIGRSRAELVERRRAPKPDLHWIAGRPASRGCRISADAQPTLSSRDASLFRPEVAMLPFTVNPHRFDPYRNFKFRVKWDGRYVAGISRISGLKRTTEVVEHRSGGDPNAVRRSPGITKYGPITLERGVTHDTAFEEWAGLVSQFGAGAGAEMSLKHFRKDIRVDLFNEAGQLAVGYKVYRCWVSEYHALPDLDANANAVAIEHLVLQNEGWERDRELPEPEEH